MTDKPGGDFGAHVWGCDDSFSQGFIKFGYETKTDYDLGLCATLMSCTIRSKPVTI